MTHPGAPIDAFNQDESWDWEQWPAKRTELLQAVNAMRQQFDDE